MSTSFTTPTLVNDSSLGGDQTAPMTVALSNGGYAVAWTSTNNNQSDVFFQRFDAAGNAVGGPVSAGGTLATSEVLNDIIVTADGRMTLAWVQGGSTVVTRSFDASTGAATSGEVVTTPAFSAPSAQLVATAANQYKLLIDSNATIEQATFNTAGATVAAKTTIALSGAISPGLAIVEAITGASGEQLMLLANGVIVSTNGQVLNSVINPSSDFMKLSDGTYVLAQGSSEEARLTAISGIGALSANYTVTGQATTNAVVTLGGTTSPTTFDKTVVSLGDGRIMMFFVSDTGTAFVNNNDPDGLYSVIYNTQSGIFESGNTTTIRIIGQISTAAPVELTNLGVDAALLADGRVALTFAQKTGLGLLGFDIYSTILDPRLAGVTMAGTAAADTLVGTNFANSPDTVSYAAVAGLNVVIDLANNLVNAGAGAGDVLTNIENVTGTGLADGIYGNASANEFLGGAGADRLFGRDGNDTLTGGNDDDLIAGGAGADALKGEAGNDVLSGGADNDTLDGGTENDSITGGGGNDTIFGGDGIDKLYGNADDDSIDAGAGADFVAGGLGNDTLFGGADNDTIIGGDGDDTIDGGTGNDSISAGNGFNVVDGGAGTDTISYAQLNLPLNQVGIMVDLEPSMDPFGGSDGVIVDDDILVNIENVIGGDGNDFIYGNSLSNVLRGSAGSDTLMGRGNNDTLIGGAGNDRFVFEALGTAVNDQIRDFTVGSDKVLFVSTAFGNIAESNIAASFVSNALGAATIAGAQFAFDNTGGGAGRLFFDADGTGAGAAILIATLNFTTPDGLTTFSAADFAFV